MMLFRLSFNNMKKSIKDYTIYFLTLVLGVAIFYMFNSLDSQQAMLTVSRFTKANYKINDTNAWNGISVCGHCTRIINCICK